MKDSDKLPTIEEVVKALSIYSSYGMFGITKVKERLGITLYTKDEAIAQLNKIMAQERLKENAHLKQWLVRHDQAPMDSSRYSIKSKDVFLMLENRADEIQAIINGEKE